MKKNYVSLEMDVITLLAGDILTFSTEEDFIDDPYTSEWWD